MSLRFVKGAIIIKKNQVLARNPRCTWIMLKTKHLLKNNYMMAKRANKYVKQKEVVDYSHLCMNGVSYKKLYESMWCRKIKIFDNEYFNK